MGLLECHVSRELLTQAEDCSDLGNLVECDLGDLRVHNVFYDYV